MYIQTYMWNEWSLKENEPPEYACSKLIAQQFGEEIKLSKNPFTEKCVQIYISVDIWLLCSLSSFTQVCNLSCVFLISKGHWKISSPCYTNDSLSSLQGGAFLPPYLRGYFLKIHGFVMLLLFTCSPKKWIVIGAWNVFWSHIWYLLYTLYFL